MRTILMCAALVALVAVPASAQLGVQAGAARDWVKLGDGQGFKELASPLAGASYDLVLGEEGDYGLTIGYKGAQDGVLISQYLVEYWGLSFQNVLEWFGGGQFETWTRTPPEIGTQFLGGARAGIRFELADVPFEVSGNYSRGTEGRERWGMFFGARVVDVTGGATE